MNSDKDSDEAYDEAVSIALSQTTVSEEKPDKYLEMEEPAVVWVPAEIEEDKYMKKLEDINLESLCRDQDLFEIYEVYSKTQREHRLQPKVLCILNTIDQAVSNGKQLRKI